VQIRKREFYITTLWGNISPQRELYVKNNVPIFLLLKILGKHYYQKILNLLHKESIEFLDLTLQINSKSKNIVITHHVPTLLNYPEIYKNSMINEAFAVEMFDFICKNNIEYWIYGHSHVNTLILKLGKTKLITNQLGYIHCK